MSGKYSSVMMFACLVAIAMAANWAEENSSTPINSAGSAMRGPSSLTGKKVALMSADPMLHHTEKIHGPIRAIITLLGDRPSQPGDVFVVQGTLTSSDPLTDVDFKWALPEGVELINGQQSGRIAVLGPSQSADVQLTLKTKTGEDHNISLVAGTSSAEGGRSAVAVNYSTLMEPAIEAGRENLKQSTKRSLAEDASTTGGGRRKLKVMH